MVIKTYALPGNQGGDFALNLDPDGTDFWTSDDVSGDVWEVNIATGAIDEQWKSGDPGTTFGLVVAGQITAVYSPARWVTFHTGEMGDNKADL